MENKSEYKTEARSSSPTHSQFAESSVQHAEVNQSGSSSATSDETASVTTTAFLVPSNPVPASTPTAGSLVEGMNNSDFYQATAALGQLHLGGGPTSSIISQPPTPAAMASITRIDTDATVKDEERVSTPKPKPEHDETPPNEHVHEHSLWGDIAREDLLKGLERAMQYAKDKARVNNAKTAEQYYSEMLGDAIKVGDLKFDAKYLQ